jgi:hypothetical protein
LIDPTSVAVQSGPANGSVAIDTSTGMLTYTPNAGFSGSDSFTYTVDDTNGTESNPAMVSINVNPAIPPVAGNDDAFTDYQQAVDIYVNMNDYAPAGSAFLDTSSVAIVGGPSHGSLAVDECGIVTYTPNNGFNGTDTFTYTVSDTMGTVSNVATVNIYVVAPVAPVALDDMANTDSGMLMPISVLMNDYASMMNTSLDTSSITIVSAPSHGIVSIDATTGEILYMSDAGFSGLDTFSYVVSDTNGLPSNVATVSVTVNAVNLPPVIEWITATNVDGDVWVVEGQVSDENLLSLSVSLSGLVNTFVTVETTGAFMYQFTLTPGTVGNIFAYAYDDQGLWSDLAQAII